MAALSREFRRQCEKIAGEQRARLNLPPYAPLPGERLVTHYGGVLRTPDEMPGTTPEMAAQAIGRQHWWGALLPLTEEPFILLHPHQPPTRRESTIMHEMSHFFLKHASRGYDPETNLPLRCPQDEREAAYLGGCLQLPRLALVWALQSGLTVTKTAAHFGASEQMAVYRANIVGVRLSRR